MIHFYLLGVIFCAISVVCLCIKNVNDLIRNYPNLNTPYGHVICITAILMVSLGSWVTFGFCLFELFE